MLDVQGRGRRKKLPSDSRVISDDTVTPQRLKTAVEVFDESCPIYMAYGMTYDEFWHCDPLMYIMYRDAYKLERRRRNEDMWLQGFYNFEAISTAISNILGKKVTKYRDKPLELYGQTEAEKEDEVEKAKQKVIAQLNAYMARWQKEQAKGKKADGSSSRGTRN